MDRDLLAELASIKDAAGAELGTAGPADQADTTVTPLTRLDEHYAAFRHSLAHALGRGEEA